MRQSVVLNMKRSTVREAVSGFRTANPCVFGVVLCGTDRNGSDLDLAGPFHRWVSVSAQAWRPLIFIF